MSLNVYVTATIAVEIGGGGWERRSADFDLWQTPTRVTERILDSDDPIAEYEKWVETLKNPDGKEHVQELKRWLSRRKEEGWKIEWYTV